MSRRAPEAPAVEREVRIEAPPEAVYAYFVDPALMVRWMGRRADLDPRPGGAFEVDVDGSHVARGRYVELVPHERIVFTWGWEGPDPWVAPGGSTVEVTLVADGDATLLRLVHTHLPDAAVAAMHGEGWDHYLPRLAVAPTADPGPDEWATQTPDGGT